MDDAKPRFLHQVELRFDGPGVLAVCLTVQGFEQGTELPAKLSCFVGVPLGHT